MMGTMRIAAVLSLGLALTACAAKPPGGDGSAAPIAATRGSQTVECRDRPQIKQLGRNVRYLGSRPPLPMAAGDCERQGGRSVMADQALLGTR